MASYPIRAAAKITGISLDTLRAWERRYQAVVPERTARGRQYSAADLERLRLLGALVSQGHAIGGIAAKSDEELRFLLAGPAAAAESGGRASGELWAPVLEAIQRFDGAAAQAEVGRLAALLPARELVLRMMTPLMHEVGLRWHAGTLTIAQEHMASQILRDALGSLMRLHGPTGPAVRMVFATPAGDTHEFGIQTAAVLASLSGIEPVYLGADLPAAEIVEAAVKTGARVIVLGIALPAGAAKSSEVRAVAEAMPEGTMLWLGGGGSASVDLAGSKGSVARMADLAAFETECRRLASIHTAGI